jgi:filamentous hemagglutinin family protein
MKPFSFQFWFLEVGIFLFASTSTFAQVVPDKTLPTNSVVTEQDDTIQIDGGTRPNNGANLFHSFEAFSVPLDRTVLFNNAQDVQNILTRVTGNLSSNIEGTLAANGSANLFLINPNGVIFGENATLNIGGSFFATTADKVQFADGTEFSAANPQSKPILTVSAPIGLGFGQSPGQIVNRSLVGLQVAPERTLALVGGDVQLEGGILTAEGGRIELGSVGSNGSVDISPTSQGWTLDYSKTQAFQDISLSQLAFVDTSGDRGGEMQIQARNLTLSGDAIISSITFGTETGGNIVVRASDSVEMSGDATTIYTATEGTGNGGNLTIETGKLIIRDGAYVETPTLGEGKGGDLTVKASEFVELTGTTSDSKFPLPSGLFASVGTGEITDVSGDGGNIFLETKRLAIEDGAAISANMYGTGQAGNVTIKAFELVELVGEQLDTGLPSVVSSTVVQSDTKGNGGTIAIETEKLVVRDGAQVLSSTFGEGNAGEVKITASGSVELTGTTADNLAVSGLFASVERGAAGNGGKLTVETRQLIVRDGAQIGTTAQNTGAGGTLTIDASSILLSGTSPLGDEQSSSGVFISAEPAYLDEFGNPVVTTADAGDLIINARQLTVEKGAKISGDTFSTGAGADITLNVDRLVVSDGGLVGAGSLLEENPFNSDRGNGGTLTVNASESVEVVGTGNIGITPVNSSLFTEAEGTGNAGNLNITTPQLTVQNGGEITARAIGTGSAGEISVNTDIIQLDRGSITASTNNGTGGNVFLQANDLILLDNNSLVSARASNNADGGNVGIDTTFVVATPNQNNDIVANAEGGDGGRITISNQRIFGLQEQRSTPPNNTNDIDASSEFGNNGTVTIVAPEVDSTSGILELPSTPIDAESLIARDVCAIENGKIARGSSFVVTGKGGLPPSSEDPLVNSYRIVEWESAPQSDSNNGDRAIDPPPSNEVSQEEPAIAQAQGWKLAPDGTLLLTAEAIAATPQTPAGVTPRCHSQ